MGISEPSAAAAADKAEVGENAPSNPPHGSNANDNAHPLADAPEELRACINAFRKWFGPTYEEPFVYCMLSTAATRWLDGDPLWVLFIAGSGHAKTETLMPLQGLDHTVLLSELTSTAAFLPVTGGEGTGGILPSVGDNGMLLVKDFTTILSMNQRTRDAILAAFREIYDGEYSRSTAKNAGTVARWKGRCTLLGACTTKYDHCHGVISQMGDRFLLARANSRENRMEAAKQAEKNTGHEVEMRAELRDAVHRVLLNGLDPKRAEEPSQKVTDELTPVANLVALARSACETDFKGFPLEAHDPEMPTRLIKQLKQLVRGALAIGLSEPMAIAVALKVARDTIPPGRWKVLSFLLKHPGSDATVVMEQCNMAWQTARNRLEELRLMGLVQMKKEVNEKQKPIYRYTIHPDFLKNPAFREWAGKG